MVEAVSSRLEPGDRILIVDDDSPDGTGRIADRLAGDNELVEVLHRTGKAGLGAAYVAGFERALAGGAGGRAGGQGVYNWALNGVAPNASDSKVEPADKAHPGNGRASDDFGRDRGYADTAAAPAGVAANQFFGEVHVLRGQGIGAGGGLRELDQVVAAGAATED
jgi:hypothetical protein